MAKCKEGCVCGRHTSPKLKGRKLSPESIAKRQATRMKNMDQIAKKTSETLKRKYQEDTEFREAHQKRMRDPEHLKKMSEATKKEWQDPEKRKNHLDGIRRHLEDEEAREAAMKQRAETRWNNLSRTEREERVLQERIKEENRAKFSEEGLARLRDRRGEKNPNWNPEWSKKLYEGHEEEFEESKRLVWERDDSTCQSCQREYELGTRWTHVVHHIDEDPSNNEVGNLILLCRSCHRLVHSEKIECPTPRKVEHE